MATDVAGEDFVTIVPVGEGRPPVKDSTFVTVLTVGAASGASEVIVRRPKGERLGLGLKFEGGSAAAEKVRRLLVQSCAENSPAANACAPWGKLIPGDEILAIDGVSVSDLTRIDCVRRLKDSDESLKLLVRHFEPEDKLDQDNNNMEIADTILINSKPTVDMARPTALPPPVPPRKLGKKNSFKDKQTLQTVGEQNAVNSEGQKQSDKEITTNGQHNGYSTMTKLSRKSSFDSHILRQNKEGITYLKKGSPEEVRRLVRRLSDGKAMPPEAEVYMDLLSTEWERCLVFADAESDDTGSSISTVVDRLGSMASSVENSIPSTPTMQPKTIDIQKVLNCIENIDSNILKDITSNRFLERQIDVNKDSTIIEKTSSINGYNSHEKTTQISDEKITSSKTLQQNDNNNNNTTIPNVSSLEINQISTQTKSDMKTESVIEKPKPMPRNTKIERSASEKKPRPLSVPETPPPPPPVNESLLTPTKKNCIESWLQRSEAEMNSNNVDKLEETMVPEVLPRLIDFVPKPQFKESNNESTLVRPTAPPPPPPVETREDGSGASLDTIGELDESSDVTDNLKPIVIENETKERKSSYESNFWEDRVIKSDTEDKSLSNDETPLPTCPRQPPDGVETPSDVVEKMPEPQTRIQPRLTIGWPTTTRTRFSYSSRTQDARSEASVKDKIAMFSNDHTISSDRLDKCGTLPARTPTTRKSTSYANNYSDVSSLDRRLTRSQDNLDELPRSYKRPTERREVLGALETTPRSSTTTKINRPLHTENKPFFYGSTTTLPAVIDSTFTPPIYHARSISDDNSNKNVPAHKSNLEYLIEQRKKSMSKLRGLVISEAQAPIIDLPEIKVQDPLTKSFHTKCSQNNIHSRDSKINNTKPIDLNDTKWKTTILPNNIPKYSPAFKRKSLQVYSPISLSKESTPERKLYEKIDTYSKQVITTSKPQRTLLDLNNDTTRTSTLTSQAVTKTQASKKEYINIFNPVRDYKNVDIKICTAADIVDSDNDSAMSSTQSSYRSSASSPMNNLDTVESDSSRLSPRILHYTPYSLVKPEIPTKSSATEKNCEEYVKRNVCRSVSSDTNVSLSSSAGSAATSGSQASCSSLESSVTDSDKRKVSKTFSIDTINRRNILASAKCRSGRDDKLKSPVIETKFSHESVDRPSSPVCKATDRLSTLTSSVSAMSNKGENRRRNKKIAETDSDSDSDINVRQRKTEYKNTRLKRNSSSSNKHKQIDSNLETSKVEDVSNITAEKSIKEVTKLAIDNIKSKEIALNENNNLKLKNNDMSIKKEKINNSIIPENQNNSHVTNTNKTLCLEKSLVALAAKRDSNKEETKDKLNDSATKDVIIPTRTIQLKRGVASGVGLILAGGVDCEAKDVTIHRVLVDSVADKAGLKRGTKVRTINGYAMSGLTHAQSVTILKEQRSEIIIEIEHESRKHATEAKCGSESAESKVRHEANESETQGAKAGTTVTVLLEKAGGGAGLGFGLDGGRDSPHGDRPLTIKKLFAGGAAAQSGRILVGAELLSAGGQSMEGFTRTQAWAALKALPSGTVALVLRNPKI
ncbi:PDZ domain-containing protein big bang [Aphomia sociella]